MNTEKLFVKTQIYNGKGEHVDFEIPIDWCSDDPLEEAIFMVSRSIRLYGAIDRSYQEGYYDGMKSRKE